MEFFKPENSIRSATIGGLIMSTALGCGAVTTPKVQALLDSFKAYLDANPLAYCLIGLFMMHKAHEKLNKSGAKGN